MKFLFLYTASVLLSAVAVWASSVTLTEPEPNQVWETGSTVHIKWKVNDPKAAKKIRLQYASGPSQALVINGLIADRVNGSSGSYSWKIPKDLKPKKYVIEAGPSAKDLSFAGYITIRKANDVSTKKKHSVETASKTKESAKHHTSVRHTSKKHASVKTKHQTTTKKKHTTTKKTHTTTKPSSSNKDDDIYRSSAVCIGYPTRGEGIPVSKEYVRCHSLPKQDSHDNKITSHSSSKKKSKTVKKSKTSKKHHNTTSKKN